MRKIRTKSGMLLVLSSVLVAESTVFSAFMLTQHQRASNVSFRQEFPRVHRSASEASPHAIGSLTPEELHTFVFQKEALLESTLTLRIEEDIPELMTKTWSIPLNQYEQWIVPTSTHLGIVATVDQEQVRTFIEQTIAPNMPAATNVRITALSTEGQARAEVQGRARDGWTIPLQKAAALISRLVSEGLLTINLPVQRVPGRIVNETELNLGSLQLLSRGRSDFSGSVPNRVFNITKALNEHLNGVLISPGERFSFNGTLGGEVEESTGWKTALGIFNGEELQPTPGGGICQTSTTVYRAAVQAGLPIEEQRNHSIYVKYYRTFGEGLDATIYPGSQDLAFTNNTPGYLFLRAYAEDDEAFVEIYGIPDGRQVALEGPFRKHDAPRDILLHPDLRWGLTENSIAWRQRVMLADGTEEETLLVSRYTTDIPQQSSEEISITLFDPGAIPDIRDSGQQEQT